MKLIIIVISLTVLASIIEIICQEQLEESGKRLIEWIQDGRNEINDYFFILIGNITSVIFFVISGVVYLIGNRETGFLGILGSQLGAAFSGALKMVFAHPRPF